MIPLVVYIMFLGTTNCKHAMHHTVEYCPVSGVVRDSTQLHFFAHLLYTFKPGHSKAQFQPLICYLSINKHSATDTPNPSPSALSRECTILPQMTPVSSNKP